VQYFVMNKPPGCITARVDHRDRPTVYDHVPTHFPSLPHVGRLDYDTEGLLLFTDDGRLAQGLLNPGFKGLADPESVPPIEKVYRVKVRDRLERSSARISLLRKPLRYRSGVVTKPARVELAEYRKRSTWLEIRICEGRHRQIRNLCARSALQVLKLRRIQVGPLRLGNLKMRWCRPLTQEEVEACYRAALPRDPRLSFEPIDDSEAARAARP
jgi:pseudouridine synthase